MKAKNALYIFIDESGNFDFSKNGTKYFILSSLTIERPFPDFDLFTKLKYDLWEKDIDFEYFHASEDNYQTRNEFFKIISSYKNSFSVDSVIVEKSKTHPTLQDHNNFYKKVFHFLLSYVLKKYDLEGGKIYIITDKLPLKKKQKEVEKAIKLYLSSFSKTNKMNYKIYHYDSKSDINLQIIDYINWAIYQKWTNDKFEYYNEIKSCIASEFDVFINGSNHYY